MISSKIGKILSIVVIALIIFVAFAPMPVEGRLKSNWSRNYGGEFHDIAHEVLIGEDGGYLLAGYSNSFGVENRDQIFLVKTNSNGFTEWRRDIGGEYSDKGYAATNTEDGGYAIAGLTTSLGGRDNYDFYLVKTNSEGNVEWENNYGGDHNEIAYDVIQTSDGGYLLGGTTVTFGHRGMDWWLVRTDAEGNKIWSRYYGGNQDEVLKSVAETEEGNFVLGGSTASYADPGFGLWALEINEGEIDEEYMFSLDYNEYGEHLEEGPINEKLRMAFENNTYEIKDQVEVLEEHGEWFISEDGETKYRIEVREEVDVLNIYDKEKEEEPETGKEGVELEEDAIIWETNIGGTLDDKIHDLIVTQDGNYAAAGETQSYTETGSDFWLVKISSEGEEMWNRSYGGDFFEVAHSITETQEGTLMMAGYETSWGGVQEDFFIVETDENGEELFRYDTGGERTDIANSIITVDENTFAVAGKTRSFGGGGYSFYLVELGRPTEMSVPLVLGAVGIGVVGIYAVIKLFKKYRYLFKFKRF